MVAHHATTLDLPGRRRRFARESVSRDHVPCYSIYGNNGMLNKYRMSKGAFGGYRTSGWLTGYE